MRPHACYESWTQGLSIPDRQPLLPPLDTPLLLGQQLQELLFFISQSLSEAWLISMCIWSEVCGLLISWYKLQRCSHLVKLKAIKVHKLVNVLWRPSPTWTRISNQRIHAPEWFCPRLKLFLLLYSASLPEAGIYVDSCSQYEPVPSSQPSEQGSVQSSYKNREQGLHWTHRTSCRSCFCAFLMITL